MEVCSTTCKHGRFLSVISRDSLGIRYSKNFCGCRWEWISREKIFGEKFSIFSVWVGLIYLSFYEELVNKYLLWYKSVMNGESAMIRAFQRAIELPLTPSRTWNIRIDVYVRLTWFQPYSLFEYEYPRGGVVSGGTISRDIKEACLFALSLPPLFH